MAEEIDRDRETPAAAPGPSPVRWLVAAHIVLLAATAPFGWAPLVPQVNRWLIGALIGLAFAEGALFVIWLTLGDGLFRRILLAVLVFIVLACLLPVAACSMPVFALPLLIARSEGMQLRRFTYENMPGPKRLQFSLSQLMWGCAVVVVLFALAEFRPSRLEFYVSKFGDLANAFTAFALVVIGTGYITAISTIPLVSVWAVLSPGRVLPRLALAVAGWTLGATWLLHYARAMRPEPVAMMCLSTSILLVTLGVLRGMRYRLTWQREPTTARL